MFPCLLPRGGGGPLAPHAYTNVVIATFVTAQARLKLYSYLEFLGELAIYFDIDSVVFIQKPGEPSVDTGEFLGDMTEELEKFGPGSYFESLLMVGPRTMPLKSAMVW